MPLRPMMPTTANLNVKIDVLEAPEKAIPLDDTRPGSGRRRTGPEKERRGARRGQHFAERAFSGPPWAELVLFEILLA